MCETSSADHRRYKSVGAESSYGDYHETVGTRECGVEQ